MTLIVAILMVALRRYFTIAIDPINGRGEHHVAVEKANLTNTVCVCLCVCVCVCVFVCLCVRAHAFPLGVSDGRATIEKRKVTV